MQEALKKVTNDAAEPIEKCVTLCLNSRLAVLNGSWSWDMSSPAVYCSDVMFFPEDFVGTKGIIHPDDLSNLKAALNLLEEKDLLRLDFRIITTYGEVKTVSGQRVSLGDDKKGIREPVPGREAWEEVLQEITTKKENDFLQLRRELNDYTERLHGVGSWMINRHSGQAWFSDNVFRIHGVAPQSLNVHANTFNHFIYKEDRITVLDAFEKAYAEQLPLHIEYRIVSANGELRYVQQLTKWFYASNGQEIFSGIVRDVTAERAIADELMAAQSHTVLNQHLLKFSEQQLMFGFWYMNLTTRKTSYSDNYYRIYGLKQNTVPAYNSFLNLVHADDRSKVRNLVDKMYNEHVLPETEFRIVRPDGKLRYLKQSGKLFISPAKELFMIGLVQDITVYKGLEKKIQELDENVSLTRFVAEMSEEKSETCSFIWLPEGYMQWSDGFYRLLGYKPEGVEAQPRFLYKHIHPGDLKTFRDAEALLLNNRNHDDIVIRLVSKAGVRQVKISFRPINYGKDAVIALVHDISRQAQLNEHYSKNKAYAELVEESVTDMVVFTNVDHTILHWNKIAEEKTGISKDSALFQNLFDILPGLNEEEYLGQLQSASKGNEIHSTRVANTYLRKPHDFWLMPLKNEQNEVIGVLHVVQDISKQLELQQQLSERLNFIESLVESSVDRIVVLDRYMNYLYWNRKAEEYYSINKERVLGKNILEIFPSFRNDPSYNEFRKVLRGETVYLPAVEIKETEEYFETYLIPIKDEDHDVTAVLWIVHDLSREYRLAKERTQTANLLHATMDASTDMVQVFEAVRNEEGEIVDFKYVLLNHEAQKWMPAAVGKSLLQVQPGVVEEGIFKEFKKVVETGIPSQYEKYYAHEQFDGWFYQSVVKLNDGVATTTTDITARKKAEHEVLRLKDEAAQKITDRYYTIFNSIEEGFCIFELLYDEQGKAYDLRFVEVNPAFERLTGLQNIVGKTGKESRADLESYCIEIFDKVVRTGEAHHFENYHETTNRWYDVDASRVSNDDIHLVAAVFNNITERKQRENQQEYLLRLNDTVRSISDPIETEEKVAALAMEYFGADRCYYASIEEKDSVIKRDAKKEGLPSVEGRYPIESFAIFKKVVDEGVPFAVNDVTTSSFLDEPLRQLCLQLGVISFVDVPVMKNGKAVGIFCLVQSKPRSWTENEVRLAVETAERTWAAIEKAKTEEALRQSEAKFRVLNESGIVAVAFFDTAGKIKEANDAFLTMLRLTREELNSGKVRWDVYTPGEWLPRTLEAIEEFKQTGYVSPYEKQFIRADGQLRWGLFSGAALDNGKTGVSLVIDITEQKEDEEQLKKFASMMEQQVSLRTVELEQINAELENFKRIIDGSHDSIISLDLDGRITYWNRAAEVLYGYSEEEVVGKPIAEFLIPQHKLEEFHAIKERSFEKGEAIIDLQTQRMTKDGRTIDVLINLFPLRDNGKIIGSCGIARDITERKKSEDELRKNLTILQHTEQLAQTGSWEYVPATGEFEWSDGMYKLFGLPQQMRVRPETYLDCAVEEDRSVAKRIVSKLKKKQDGFEEQLKIKKGSEQRLLRIKASLVHDSNGKVEKIIGVDIDITDIQKAEERLQESRHWLEQTTRVSPDSIVIYNLQKREPLYLNSCLADWIGIKNSDLTNLVIEERLNLVHEEDRLKLLHFNEKVAAASDGEVITIEYRMKTSENKIIWVRNRSKPFQRNASGRVTHILSILQNVTQEIALREELKRRTQYAESVIDANVDRIAVYDRDLKIIAWNRRAEEITGQKKQNVIGKKVFDLFPRVEQDEELRNAHFAALEGRYVSLPARKGVYTNHYYERFFIPLKNDAGQTFAVVSLMHDVSQLVNQNAELKELNQSLEHKNILMEQKNEEITSFAFVASHDMKEPLRKIHTFSDWLIEQEAQQLSPKGKSMVEKIGASVHRMEILIEDILVLTKIHSDTHREENVDLNKILNQVTDDMADRILETSTKIIKNELPVIKANSNQIFYLFKNLISNAIKFQKPGNIPQLAITSEIVNGSEVNMNEGVEEYLKLSFADNGFGFDLRYTKKIFQVFQRLHGKHEFEGTGIGLAICKKIMENHNGAISVESEQGQGSTFNCFFPLQ